MTTLQLFPPNEHDPKVPVEWGTGNTKDQPKDLWVPKPPTWHQKDIPIQQFYTLTQLKKSNVRLNDQLVPEPNDFDMSKIMIREPFPAEGPYSSHTSRLAVFPSFTCAEDSTRGVTARKAMPIGPDTPATNYDVQIIKKIKGFPYRWEVQQLPPESKKKGLHWKGEEGFHQLYKEGGVNPTEFYPWPPKTVRPNLEPRPPHLGVSQDTATTTRNVERKQWRTSYSLDHTDSGQSNPLDTDTSALPQRFITVHDPVRPMEGRIHRQIAPYRPAPPSSPDTWDVKGKPTLHDREEHRLHHGTNYQNYPTGTHTANSAPQWKKLDFSRHPDKGFDTIKEAAEEEEAENVPEEKVSKAGPGSGKRVTFLEDMKESQHARNQQMEAQNRFQVLELQQPSHDMQSLHYKYERARPDELPNTFYSHEGRYNEERAGLYKTTYDPYRQYQSMNERETSGDHVMNTSSSHVDALQEQTQLSYDMGQTFSDSKTLPWQRTKLSGRVSPRQPHGAFAEHRGQQKQQLQPNMDTARDRVQENGFIQRETEEGDNFNTQKFLQENQLHRQARAEPMVLMSTQNQDLANVRAHTTLKSPRMLRVVAAPTGGADGTQVRPNSSAFQPGSEKFLFGAPKDNVPSATNQFASNSGNIAPQGLSRSWTDMSAYGKQFPAYDLRYKHDERFDFKGGVGAKKPQTKLVKIQDSFFKSSAHKDFHSKYYEMNPDLRENISDGKKHEFDGMNAQVLHG